MGNNRCKTCKYDNKEWWEEPCDSCTVGGENNHYEERDNEMDKMIFDKKHLTIYFSTLQIGFGISYVTQYKELNIMLGVIEINIR